MQLHNEIGGVDPNRKLRLAEYEAPKGIRLVDEGGVTGNWLQWQPVSGYHRVKPVQDIFASFLELNDASDREILSYAARYGVLGLCREHMWPVDDLNHPQRPLCARLSEGEPVYAWRRWSRIARAIFEISQSLADGEPGASKLWESLAMEGDRWIMLPWSAHRVSSPQTFNALTRNSVKSLSRKMEWQKTVTISSINRWLEMGNVRPALVTDESTAGSRLTLTGSGLFGALAIGLLENSERYAIAACTGCRKFYNPELRPKTGQDRYCPKCRKDGVPVAMAKHRRLLKLQREKGRKQ